MYIEDIIHTAVKIGVKFNSWDSSLITSFHSQTVNGNGLTEKQAALAVKTLKRYLGQINQLSGYDFTSNIENPTYRYNIRTINNNKTISIIKNSEGKKLIKVEFPFDEKLIDKIRKERSKLNQAFWNKDEKSWIFSLDESSIQFLIGFVEEHNFVSDEEFNDYREQIKRIQKEFSKYIPMVVKNGDSFELANVSTYTPKISSKNLVESLFEARKSGIFVWDESIEKELDSSDAGDFIKRFLKNSPEEKISINKNEDTQKSIKDAIKHLTPCLFIIPGGSELEKLQYNIDLLNSMGIENSQISVLFRLPNDTNADFNKFVKTQALNSPITENTQAVFISGKIPKPVIESKISFNLIVNHGFYNVHYTTRDFVRWHHNVIHVSDSNQRNLDFQ